MGEGKSATLRIEAPEGARKPVTTIGPDPRYPLTGGLELNLDGELSLGRGEVCTYVNCRTLVISSTALVVGRNAATRPVNPDRVTGVPNQRARSGRGRVVLIERGGSSSSVARLRCGHVHVLCRGETAAAQTKSNQAALMGCSAAAAAAAVADADANAAVVAAAYRKAGQEAQVTFDTYRLDVAFL